MRATGKVFMASDGTGARPKAATPRGFRDYFGAQAARRTAMLAAVAKVYESYGFDALETSAIEALEALGEYLPDVDRPNAGVFAWEDETAGWLALRYDLTAPLARVYAQHRHNLPTPYRRYSFGPVWRNEKPDPGRYRQFYQCDADTVGTPSIAAEAELCAMLCDALQAVGLDRGDFRIRISNRKLLDGTLESAGITDPECSETGERRRAAVMRSVDKLDRLGPSGVRALLGDGRKDASGDFTDGAGLSPEQTERVMAFTTMGKEESPALMFSRLGDLVGSSAIGMDGIREMQELTGLVESAGLGQVCKFDPGIVRGLAYYTGPVIEAELTFDVSDEKGRVQRLGSIAGGGRYDRLVRRFTGQEVPATGISLGVDRLLAALDMRDRNGRQSDFSAPVVVTVMESRRMGEYLAMAAELRAACVRAEVYLGKPGSLRSQLKYADGRCSPAAVIAGSDEFEKGQVTIKDLALGARMARSASREEWQERPSQVTIPRAGMVAHIRQMVAAER